MQRILITSGPTRQYLDPVRYLSNASSGRMGAALAQAALARGHEVTVVSGPVSILYPAACRIIPVVTTDDLMQTCLEEFPRCDGVIGAAAPCDYQPLSVEPTKMVKNGQPRLVQLIETEDVIATLGRQKQHQWVVGFALETDDHHFRAITKLEKKCCDLIVLNEPSAMDSLQNSVEILGPQGEILAKSTGPKELVANRILQVIQERFIDSRTSQTDREHSLRSASREGS
ncbi:MAG: phosphopantothenoylcysteine decarboxylase [Planctomycetota bacterium]|nr:phosphopantothenoylcysteine decarboxylase [Planctomycetota bacterium]MDA1178041.1 phosphopantothenoylcysteine decarboxylase [Planctomycetota bacterium]